MDPSEALRSIETVLRIVVRSRLGDEWLSFPKTKPREKLEERVAVEQSSRRGVRVSTDLLEYTDLYELIEILEQDWAKFKPIFGDWSSIKPYFGIAKRVRNTVAHNRSVVRYEQELLSGTAGYIRNLVALNREEEDPSREFYPLIEKVEDNLGRAGFKENERHVDPIRVNVGDSVSFVASASDSRGRVIQWGVAKRDSIWFPTAFRAGGRASGENVTLQYEFTEWDVSEFVSIAVAIRADERYHRRSGYDDMRVFTYAVNPPL
ncbi:hypothetical protein [Rathayibacter festucae]|uniref:hypothetical protein n=1 Tax=Rathayibacter festucae TaxID=110937 RepID=UPI000FDB9A90|nr:hypothetical protein [Rathayibacter festucae]